MSVNPIASHMTKKNFSLYQLLETIVTFGSIGYVLELFWVYLFFCTQNIDINTKFHVKSTNIDQFMVIWKNS